MTEKGRTVTKAYSMPLVVTISTLIPGLNVLLFGHAGLGHVFLVLCFPWFVVQLLLAYQKIPSDRKRMSKRFFIGMLLSYVPGSVILAIIGAFGILSTGLHGEQPDFWRYAFSYWQGLVFPLSIYSYLKAFSPS